MRLLSRRGGAAIPSLTLGFVQHEGGGGGDKAVKLRRPRKVVQLGVAGDQARKLQELGDALEDAVRAARTGDSLLEGLCRRIYELWWPLRSQPLVFMPTELRLAGKLVLAASAQSGRFILPAFSAGLRALELEERSTAADVARVVGQLAALETGDQDLRGFAVWLFRGGALGFEPLQEQSVFELAETALPVIDSSALWAERSTRAVHLWNDLAWRTAQLPDARAVVSQYRVPVEQLHERLVRGELDLEEEGVAALRDIAGDEVALCKAEIALLLQQPVLRRTLPRDHVVLRLAIVLERSPELDARLPDLLSDLAQSLLTGSGPAPEPRILGAALGRRLEGAGVPLDLVVKLSSMLGPELLSGMLAQVNEHGTCGDAAQAMLRGLLQQSGLQGLLARVDVARLRPPFVAALARATAALQLPLGEFVTLAGRVPPESALAIFMALPSLLPECEALLRQFLQHRAEEFEPHLPAFVRSSAAAARAAGAALCALHARGLTRSGCEAFAAAVVEVGLAREVLLPIWESPQAGNAARLAVITALASDAKLLAEALRRRGVKASDAPEIRVAIEELRWRQP